MKFPRIAGLSLLCGAAVAIAAAPAFEVAAIRAASLPTPDTFRSGQFHAGLQLDGVRFDWGFASLADLIPYAFRVKNYQVSGPGWMNQSRWNIVARLPEGASPDQAPEMMQALLADRFKLTYHREQREQPVYELTVAKGGPKMEADALPDPATAAASSGLPVGLPFGRGPGGPGDGPGGRGAGGGPDDGGRGRGGPDFNTPGLDGSNVRVSPNSSCGMQLELSKLTLQAFADTLSPFLDKPVVDATGLKGAYKANLDLPMEVLFSMMQNMIRSSGLPGPGQGGFGGPGGRGGDGRGPGDGGGRGGPLAGCPDPGAALANGDASSAPIFQAVQKLGLKLTAKKAPFDTIIVDHLDKEPSDN